MKDGKKKTKIEEIYFLIASNKTIAAARSSMASPTDLKIVILSLEISFKNFSLLINSPNSALIFA